MNWLKQHRGKLIAVLLVLTMLAAAFYLGGGAPNLRGWNVTPAKASSAKTEERRTEKSTAGSKKKDSAPPAAKSSVRSKTSKKAKKSTDSKTSGMKIDPATGKDRYQTTSVPKGKPVPKEPQNATGKDKQCQCTMSISCEEALKDDRRLSEEKRKLLPANGWILKTVKVSFREGESAFAVLKRVCRENGVPLEFTETPLYNTVYIEGIGNLYEFDCGELSGWLYSVNGWQPNYGASRYALRDGDTVCWSYTCDRTTADSASSEK